MPKKVIAQKFLEEESAKFAEEYVLKKSVGDGVKLKER